MHRPFDLRMERRRIPDLLATTAERSPEESHRAEHPLTSTPDPSVAIEGEGTTQSRAGCQPLTIERFEFTAAVTVA
jgi:hypothetical protein